MEALKSILCDHAGKYPLMQPTDAVKLIYQNEFGGGHLIRDEQACLAYLQLEYESVSQSASMPLSEAIGNGLVRVNLAALDAHGRTIEQLGTAFIRSASAHKGSMDSFRQKLVLLQNLARDGVFSFSGEALKSYLDEYIGAGCPMVSHSPQYRKAYQPAYRIALTQYFE